MADRNEEVMEMVARELEADPAATVESLHEKAGEIDPGIRDLTRRQFHARYTLPVKRRKSAGRGGRRGGKRAGGRGKAATQRRAPARGTRSRQPSAEHEEVRRVFLDFAGDFARAESKAAIVEVLAQVDDYVERVLRAARK